MNTIDLRALDGRLPLGFLAALGALRLLSEASDEQVRLSWSPQTATPQLHSNVLADMDEVAQRLDEIFRGPHSGLVPDMPADFPPKGEAPDKLRVPPDDLARLVDHWEAADCGDVRAWVRALVTDLAVPTDGGQAGRVMITRLAAPSGKMSFWTMFRKTTEVTSSRPSAFREALTGWHRVDGYTGDYLDHQVLRSGVDSPEGESSERGVPGATWLALMAMPLLPILGDGRSRRIATGWQSVGRDDVMRWPLWQPPLSVRQARVLLDHPALRLASADGDHGLSASDRLEQLGVFAISTAKRVRIPGRNSEGVLVPQKVLPVARPRAGTYAGQ